MKKLLCAFLVLSFQSFGQDLSRQWETATSRVLKGEKLIEFKVNDPGLTTEQKQYALNCIELNAKPVEIVLKGKLIIFYSFNPEVEAELKECFILPIESLENRELSYSETESIYKTK